MIHLQELDLHNVVPEQPVHQVIEFSVILMDYGYQEILRDTDSPQYHDLSRHLQDQVCENDQTMIQNSVFLRNQSVHIITHTVIFCRFPFINICNLGTFPFAC